MIDLIKISADEMVSYVEYIPRSIQQEYIFNKQIFLLGVLQMDIPSGIVVLERSGNTLSVVYMNLADALRDTGYEEMVFLEVLEYARKEEYQKFAVEY